MLLGEMLLKAGALTEAQLEQVLSAQSIYGGRLGTNLVEMGLIGEDELARVLKEKLGVPCIDGSALDAIPAEVLAVIPLEMVQRYHVLPLALDGKRLTLAMIDPSDFKAIDEIGFVTGLVIVPRVCSELRLNLALERYFGIKRELRYIPVAGGSRSRFAGAALGDARPEPGSVAELGAHPGGAPPGRHVTMEVLAERLAGAPGEAQVVSAVLWYLGGEFDRAALLRLKCGSAVGVQAVAAGDEVDGFVGYAMALDEAQQIKRVVQERELFLGEFAAGGAVGGLMRAMGGSAPAPALVVPVAVGGQVAAVICVNDLKGRLAGGVFELQRVAAMAELAFEMLRIRKRIRAS
ncbi:MAG TPA: general secretion pathway protein GspE [Geobacter sp.]|nr:general secretion pathway protein GspE [Geobacter sp.]